MKQNMEEMEMSDFVIEDGVLLKYAGKERTVVIPNEVTAIGNDAFISTYHNFFVDGCETVETIVLPRGIKKIGYRSFGGCSNLTTINLPDGLLDIGPRAFEDCQNLRNISIPKSVRKIGSRAFYECRNITQLTIPDAVQQIDAGTFFGCTRLENIHIPANVKKIGEAALDALESLRYFSADNNNPSYTCVDGVLYNKEKTVLIKCPALMDSLQEIPSSVKEIADKAFFSCRITEITIPKSVKVIGDEAFANCTFLRKVTNNSTASVLKSMTTTVEDGFLPNEVLGDLSAEHKKIAVEVFLKNIDRYSENKRAEYCEYLQKQGGKYLSDYINKSKSDIIALLLKVYAPTANAMAKALEEAKGNPEIMAFLLDYQNSHFNVAKELAKKGKEMEHSLIRTEPTVEELKKLWVVKTCEADKNKCYLTKYKGNEKHVVVPSKIGKKKVVGIENCFRDQDVQSVELPSSIGRIGESAFLRCSKLTSITIPDSVRKIEGDAFSGCTGLRSITIPRSVKKIEQGVFSGCASLTSITIPSGVKKIEIFAFLGCTGLTSITIPDSVTSIDNDAFSDCTNLIQKEDGVHYVDTWVVGCDISVTSVTLRAGTKGVGEHAFYGCSNLINITIPNGVTSIGEWAFYGCSNLTNITIPDGVTSIGEWAFCDCSNLTNITIPNGVTSIGELAFDGCSNLTSITIPDSVTKIGDCAFPELVICALSGSFAEQYAQSKNIKFEPIEE